MSKTIGKGTTLYFSTDPTTGSSNATTPVGFVRSISGPSAEADEVEATCLDTTGNYREFLHSLVDPGELSLELAWDPAQDSHIKLTESAANTTGGTFVWRMVLPTTTYEVSFDGWVKSFQPNIPIDDLMTASVTIRVTSAITWPTSV